MGLLRNILVGRADGLRARIRRILASAGLTLSGDEPAAEPPERRTTAPAQPRVAKPAPPSPPPKGFHPAADLSAIPESGLLEVIVDGQPVALCRRGDQVHAVSAVCPHAGGPIADGDIDAGLVVCPWHGWSFDVTTGECNVDPGTTLPVYEVSVQDGAVTVKLGPEP